MLPPFTAEGELPVGVHLTQWQEFHDRFATATSRRVWLFGRLQSLLALARSTGSLYRVFVWGSFVTSKPSPRDIDILLVMTEEFEVERVTPLAREVFDAVRAKLRFEADVFWARASIGKETLEMWLETYQVSRSFRKRGIVELELP